MTMKDLAQLELQAVINQINISNQALLRALGVEEEGDDGSGVCDMCAGCPNCMENICDECGEIHEEDFND